MNNALKFALIGVGVWWLLKDNISFAAASTQEPAATPSGNQPNATPSSSAAAPTPLQTQPAITEAMIYKAASDPALAQTVPGVLLTSDQWNWYNAQATGVQTTTDLFTDGYREEKITAAEYWARRQAKGLGQLVRSRMGRWS